MRQLSILLVLGAMTGCAAEIAGPIDGEDEIATADKDDSFGDPTDHGFLLFDTNAGASLTPTRKHHAYRFRVSADATVTLTSRAFPAPATTRIFLYRQHDDGSWGRAIAETEPSRSATLSQALTKGEYRAIVNAPGERRGSASFTFRIGCEGAGCANTTMDCAALDDWATDMCLPDDDAPVFWTACLADTPDGNRIKFGADCCRAPGASLGYCDGLVGPLSVTAERAEMPEALRTAFGVRFPWLRALKLRDQHETAVSNGLNVRTLDLAREVYEDECDAVPVGFAGDFEKKTSEQLLAYLRSEEIRETNVTPAQLTALGSYLGSGSFEVYQGPLADEACGTSGGGTFVLVYDLASNTVLYGVVTEWAE